MIVNKNTESIKADHYLHIHVIPKADTDLLEKIYRVSGKKMEETWREMITDQSKYVIVDPIDFLKPIEKPYPELFQYLSTRYWNK